MVRSCESLFSAALAVLAGAIVAGAGMACDGVTADDAAGAVVAGAVTAGRLDCDGCTGGLGPKYLAHRMITPNERSEATRIRNSGVNLSFCRGALTTAPQSSELSLPLNSMASLPISPELGRNQICAKVDGSAATASVQAKSHASRQSVQSPRRRSANTSAQSGSFPRIRSTNKPCRNAARATPRALGWSALPLHALQQAQQIRRQRRKLRARHRTLRVNDDVPSCGYLQPVAAHDLAQAPPDPIARYRTSQGLLDAEAETALQQLVGAEENGEVGTRTALSGAVDRIKLSAPHQPRFTRKSFPLSPSVSRSQRAPCAIRG